MRLSGNIVSGGWKSQTAHRPTLYHVDRARSGVRTKGAAAIRAALVVLGVSTALGWLGAVAWILVQLVSWWILLPQTFPATAGPSRPW